MASKQRTALIAVVVLAAISVAMVPTRGQASAGDGQFHVHGRTVIGPDGAPTVLRGVNKSGLEYTAFGYDLDLVTFQQMKSWGVNVVRVPLSPAFALPGMCSFNRDYLTTIDRVVSYGEQLGMLIILDDHFATKGLPCGVGRWNNNQPAPDLFNLAFLKVLGARYAGRSHVAIDLYNEPHDISWDVWRNGGIVETYVAVGMQALLDAVRGTGFTGLVFATGNDWGNDLREVVSKPLRNDRDVVYAAHAYPFECGAVTVPQTQPYSCEGKSYSPVLDRQIAPAIAARPVMVTEFGTNRAVSEENRSVIEWARGHGVGWMTWLWCNGLVSDFCLLDPDATPSDIGQPVYDALQVTQPAGADPGASPSNEVAYVRVGPVRTSLEMVSLP